MNFNVWGNATAIDDFEHSGYILDIQGLSVDDAHIFRTNTASPTHGLG